MKLLRKIGILFVPLYYMITWLRNRFYDLGVFHAKAYDFPVIAVGNLSVGGTGKTPMIEYLIRLLQQEQQLATLSRGYKRKKSGFQFVTVDALALDVGDEPLQFKKKFPNCIVAVDADRQNGIATIKKQRPDTNVILLDDAYQHRKVKAGLYILLTAYHNLYVDDILLPTGDLREPIIGARRASIILVTKCPENLSNQEQNAIRKKLNLTTEQSLYFSTIRYSEELLGKNKKTSLAELKRQKFTLVTGIANPAPLLQFYNDSQLQFSHLNFPDHHIFTTTEIAMLKKKPLIVTTEKDYIRLAPYLTPNELWYQPITMQFITGSEDFEKQIKNFIAIRK